MTSWARVTDRASEIGLWTNRVISEKPRSAFSGDNVHCLFPFKQSPVPVLHVCVGQAFKWVSVPGPPSIVSHYHLSRVNDALDKGLGPWLPHMQS